MIRKGLGKGLGALLASESEETSGNNSLIELKINEIEPNIHQPRKNFDDAKLSQLAESIKEHGIVQPIIVKRENDTYRIVAGERRWRAARLAGLTAVPVVIKELSNRQLMEIALIENLQREDLNPIEEAEAYGKLTEEFKMTQEAIAKAVGKSRPAIANSMRLLGLNTELKKYVILGELSSGHARTLIALEDTNLRNKAADEIIKGKLNVRDTEKLVKRYLTRKVREKPTQRNAEYQEIEERLKSFFGTKVQLLANKKKGKIMIEYYSNDELDRILEIIEKMGKNNGD